MFVEWLRSLLRPFFLDPDPDFDLEFRKQSEETPAVPNRYIAFNPWPIPRTVREFRAPSAIKWPDPVDTVPPPDQQSRWRNWVSQIAQSQSEGIVVTESFSLAKLRIFGLPSNLTIEGILDLRHCQRLRRIGDGLTVRDNLMIGGRCIPRPWYEQDLPPFPICNDAQPPIRALPRRLRVDGSLVLRSCHNLTSLPDDIQIGQGLWIENCHSFESLPESLSISGDLTLKGCRSLKALPDSLNVQGDLRLIGLQLQKLPDQIRVGGNLICECCPQLERLPLGLHVGKNLVMKSCQSLESIPRDLDVAGDIRIERCKRLTSIPPWIRIRRSLIITRCVTFVSLPGSLEVPGILDLSGCSQFHELPSALRVGFSAFGADEPMYGAARLRGARLKVVDCRSLSALPSDLELNGSIDLAGSGLTGLSDSLIRTPVMWRGFPVRPEVVFTPWLLSPETILSERNAEIRRVMIERVGVEKLLAEPGFKQIDADTDAGGDRKLYEYVPPSSRWTSRMARYLKCHCPSTGRIYILRVSPEMKTCREAAAWLAGFDNPDDYRPIIET